MPTTEGPLSLLCVGEVPNRPLGKSNYVPAPWDGDDSSEYQPTKMEFKAIELGCVKSLESQLDFPEDVVLAAQAYMIDTLKSIWRSSPEDMVVSLEGAVAQLTLDKSPGYDYFKRFKTKADVLADEETKELAFKRHDYLMAGKKENCIFGLTLKSELREKTKVEAYKTRIFAASDLHHLLASTRLYAWQNNDLMETRGHHPITIGLRMPGPEFVDTLRGMGDSFCDADLSGCDQRFPLRLARSICDIRHHFLPHRYIKAGRRLYSRVYAGLVTVAGRVYVMHGNKSGWHNTGHDNSLMSWLAIICANMVLYRNVPVSNTFMARINGDDWIYKQLHGSFEQVCTWLKPRGVVVESDFVEKNWDEVVFLSHHIRTRFVEGFGDFLVTAGNLPKLKSSVNWIKSGQTMSFEEYCVAHLIGLRMCMFPYPREFSKIDKVLTKYLSTITLTPMIKDLLTARFTEFELACLHTRVEGHFSRDFTILEEVLNSFDSLFKFQHGKNKITEKEKCKDKEVRRNRCTSACSSSSSSSS